MLQYTFLVRVIKVELRELFGSKTHEYPVSIGAELSTIKLPSRREGVGSELCRCRQVMIVICVFVVGLERAGKRRRVSEGYELNYE